MYHQTFKLFLLILVVLTSLVSITKNQLIATEIESQILNERAYSKFKQGDYEISYRLSTQALVKAEAEDNQKEEARAFSNIASNLRYFGESARALELYNKSLKISTSIRDLSGVNRALNNLASVYSDIGDNVEEKRFRDLQLENSLKTGDVADQVIAYIGLARCEIDEKQYDKALEFLGLAKTAILENPNSFLEVYVLFSEADILAAKSVWEEAIDLNLKAYAIAYENNYEGLQLSSKTNVVELFLKQKKFQQAISEALALLSKSKEIRLQTKTLQLHNILKAAYESVEDFKSALYHEREANQLKQQISGQKVKFLGEITKIDRQVYQQQEKLEELEKDQKIMSLMLAQQKQNQIIWIVSAILIFALSAFLYYRHISSKEILRQRKLNQRLEELDKVKDRVLTNTSHELRTPLNGIIGLSDVIIRDEENEFSESTLDCLKLIRSSGEQLALVVNDILELSKLKNSSLTIVNSHFDLQDLIKDVIAVCQPNLSGRDITLTNKNEKEQTLVNLDRGRVQQVLFNIIGNAIKFTDKGKIEILCTVSENKIEINVNDTGRGIPAKNLDRVFEGFEQVDAGNSRGQPGTGLGLAITKGIVEAMGGAIELTSELDKGTHVIITFPQ